MMEWMEQEDRTHRGQLPVKIAVERAPRDHQRPGVIAEGGRGAAIEIP
ncbi:MAG: hypothetical protein U5O39_06555 [Gammaproteobacteria bacterium]|nr:hypothetical protein [Gammaproteobacteria bacterium]